MRLDSLECDGVVSQGTGGELVCSGDFVEVVPFWPELGQTDIASLVGAVAAFWAVCLVFRWLIQEVRNRA